MGLVGDSSGAIQQATAEPAPALPAPIEPDPRRPKGRGRPQGWLNGRWLREQWRSGKAAELRRVVFCWVMGSFFYDIGHCKEILF